MVRAINQGVKFVNISPKYTSLNRHLNLNCSSENLVSFLLVKPVINNTQEALKSRVGVDFGVDFVGVDFGEDSIITEVRIGTF